MKKIIFIIAAITISINSIAQTAEYQKYIVPLKNAPVSLISDIAGIVSSIQPQKYQEEASNVKQLIDKGSYLTLGGQKALPLVKKMLENKIEDIDDLLTSLPDYQNDYKLPESYVSMLFQELKSAKTAYIEIFYELSKIPVM